MQPSVCSPFLVPARYLGLQSAQPREENAGTDDARDNDAGGQQLERKAQLTKKFAGLGQRGTGTVAAGRGIGGGVPEGGGGEWGEEKRGGEGVVKLADLMLGDVCKFIRSEWTTRYRGCA